MSEAAPVPAVATLPFGPFFVVGAQRSGTTLLRLMLNAHPRFAVPFESAFIPAFRRRLHKYGNLAEPARLRQLLDDIARDPWVEKGRLLPSVDRVLSRRPADYAAVIDTIFSEYAAARGKPRWGDKTPGYVVHIDTLAALFPAARFVHLVRDGRDVALSLRRVSWGSKNLIRAAEDWKWKVCLGHKMGSMIPHRYLEVRYESLIADPPAVLDRICRFLGEPYDPAMLRYHERGTEELPVGSRHWHLASTARPDAGKVEQWRTMMSAADRIVFDDVAGDALEQFGYERMRRRHSLWSFTRYARYCLVGRY